VLLATFVYFHTVTLYCAPRHSHGELPPPRFRADILWVWQGYEAFQDLEETRPTLGGHGLSA
jgi:hypothetical protein